MHRPTYLFVAAIAVLAACKANPADCTEKGNESACNDLCNTGKQEYLPLCYEMRARTVAACADGKGDCTKACELWKSSEGTDVARTAYVAKIGSDAKVASLKKTCAK